MVTCNFILVFRIIKYKGINVLKVTLTVFTIIPLACFITLAVYLIYNIRKKHKNAPLSTFMKNRRKDFRRLTKLVMGDGIIFAIFNIPLSIIG
jgi:hypothetical protein